MANELNKPDDVKTAPQNQQTTPITETPASEINADENEKYATVATVALLDI